MKEKLRDASKVLNEQQKQLILTKSYKFGRTRNFLWKNVLAKCFFVIKETSEFYSLKFWICLNKEEVVKFYSENLYNTLNVFLNSGKRSLLVKLLLPYLFFFYK